MAIEDQAGAEARERDLAIATVESVRAIASASAIDWMDELMRQTEYAAAILQASAAAREAGEDLSPEAARFVRDYFSQSPLGLRHSWAPHCIVTGPLS